MDPKDKVALLTGGRRMGQAIAVKLAETGMDVVLTYRHSKAAAEQLAREIEARGRRALAIQADVSQSNQVTALSEHILAAFGGIDVLIHMASIYEKRAYADLTEEDWDRHLEVNLKSAYLCARVAAESMESRAGGRIITVADWTAASGRPRYKGYLPYYVAKVGLIGLTQALALELAEHRILVNCIAPGPILPPPDVTPEEEAQVRAATPLGRWGGAEEIAKAVLALIQSDFITGECLRVDGGRHVY